MADFSVQAQMFEHLQKEAESLRADKNLLAILLDEIAVRALMAGADLSDVTAQIGAEQMLLGWAEVAKSRTQEA